MFLFLASFYIGGEFYSIFSLTSYYHKARQAIEVNLLGFILTFVTFTYPMLLASSRFFKIVLIDHSTFIQKPLSWSQQIGSNIITIFMLLCALGTILIFILAGLVVFKFLGGELFSNFIGFL